MPTGSSAGASAVRARRSQSTRKAPPPSPAGPRPGSGVAQERPLGVLRQLGQVYALLVAEEDLDQVLRRADVHDYRSPDVRGRELRDLTVGVVGTGRIGAAVIDRLRGFGCRTLAYDIRPRTSADHVPLDELLQQSDIVTLHTPLTADTHHLVDRRRIEQLKPGAFVVNTGRGALLDTEALIRALESGRLGGAALDVLEGEEGTFYADCRDRDIGTGRLSRLRAMSNVIISPHIAYHTDHALRDIVENSIVNCREFDRRKQHWV